jgi:hypothetical protein
MVSFRPIFSPPDFVLQIFGKHYHRVFHHRYLIRLSAQSNGPAFGKVMFLLNPEMFGIELSITNSPVGKICIVCFLHHSPILFVFFVHLPLKILCTLC